MFYRSLAPTDKNLYGVIKWMCSPIGSSPDEYAIFEGAGHYEQYIRCWHMNKQVIHTKYELLQSDPVAELRKLGVAITGEARPDWQLKEIIERQSFDRWQPHFAHSMRRGKAGDWKDYFKRQHGAMINNCLGQLMVDVGYAIDRDWWQVLPGSTADPNELPELYRWDRIENTGL
jgi:hypothetical protein